MVAKRGKTAVLPTKASKRLGNRAATAGGLASGNVTFGADSNQRRYPRIYLQTSARPLSFLLGAKLTWPNGDRVELTDLSHVGAAAARSARMPASVGERLSVRLELAGESGDLDLDVEVARVSERQIGLRFLDLSTSARRALERFLRAKLVGLHLRPVDPRYFARPGSFTHWFHGPNNTNVFLWYSELELKEAMVEFESKLLRLQNGKLLTLEAEQYLKTADQDYVAPLLNQRRKLEGAGQKNLKDFVGRVIDMLSQVDDPDEVLQPVLEALVAYRKGT